jgi:putative oxidoreductase
MFEISTNSVLGKYAEQARRARAVNAPFWILQVLLAAAFLTAGVTKVAAARTYMASVENVGWGQWVSYSTGGVEVVAAVLLLIPRTAALGAALLTLTMTGAVASHLINGENATPAIVLLVIAATVAWYRGQ